MGHDRVVAVAGIEVELPLDRISYDEMLELAAGGAKVLTRARATVRLP